MKRRSSFRATVGCFLATLAGRCIALAETTKFYWPGRWSHRSLKDHLIEDDKHLFDPARIDELTFQDCLDLHDWHHAQIGHASRTPYPDGKNVPDTEPGRGPTTKPADENWLEFMDKKPGSIEVGN
ncbi:MAG: hypothetical protein P1U89_22485 [Verrucomicrobiales bacterium]|nr:hypothetical protein [Verrucomicrobiales bacterium]